MLVYDVGRTSEQYNMFIFTAVPFPHRPSNDGDRTNQSIHIRTKTIDAHFFPFCKLKGIESVSIFFRRRVIIRHAESRGERGDHDLGTTQSLMPAAVA